MQRMLLHVTLRSYLWAAALLSIVIMQAAKVAAP
jgi:hypothetical protein